MSTGRPVDCGGLVEQGIVRADRVELLPGVGDGAGPGQLQLGTGGSACPQRLAGEGAQEAVPTDAVIPAGPSAGGWCGGRLNASVSYVLSLAFCSVRH